MPPPILEFDQSGSVVQGWGGPGPGYEWPDNEHGIFVDYKENVWVTGNGMMDTNILKFTKNGKFLRGKAFKQHILNSKTTKRKRGLRGTTTVAAVDTPKLARMLPYK